MELKIPFYNLGHDEAQKESAMPKKNAPVGLNEESFGKRLARLRQVAGYSQRDLATEIGISQRMVAYYEKGSEHIPIDLLPRMATTLGVSVDQMLGLAKTEGNGKPRDNRLWRRFNQVEKLPPAKRKPIFQLLDAFLKSEKA